jgi:hypothetical protein
MYYASGEVSNVYDNSNTQFKIVSVTHDLSQVDFFVGRNDFTQNNTYTESPDVL